MSVRFALAPLQWLATDDGWLDRSAALPLPLLVSETRRLGFTALKAEPPESMDVADYGDALREAGLTPAAGYVPAALEDADERPETVSRIGALSARLGALGVGELLIGARMHPLAPRVLHPAVGFDADESRLGEIAKTLELVGAETRKHSVVLCIHPHVGTWVETESETEWLLDRLHPELVALGPDTGHLAWAGVDVVSFARRHFDRIKAVHLKDVRMAVAERTRGTDATYQEVVMQDIWAEPGLGDLDLVGFLDALGPEYDGWAVVEVDRPSLPSPEASVEVCARWVDAATLRDAHSAR